MSNEYRRVWDLFQLSVSVGYRSMGSSGGEKKEPCGIACPHCLLPTGKAMTSKILRIAAAIELVLTALEACCHVGVLPLGGGQLQQIAICFIIAFAVEECLDRKEPPKRRPMKRKKAKVPPVGKPSSADKQPHP